MVNKSINNHPLKMFGDEDQEMVVILVEALGVKWNELWRLWQWKWNMRGIRGETFVLIYGISPFGLQSQCFKTIHGTRVFVWIARGTLLGFKWGWWCMLYFISKLRWNEWRYEIHLLEWVMVGIMLRRWDFRVKDRNGISNFPKLLIKAPMGRFFFKKFI